jgi:hypothetical protein
MSSRREISDLLIPWRNSLRTSVALIAAVAGRPRRVPLCRAWSSPAPTRSRRMSRSNCAYCGASQYADYAERAIMQSHNAEMAMWPAFQ